MSDYRPGRFSILPVVIKNLMIINGLIFLGVSTMPKEIQSWIYDHFALHYWGSDLFMPHQVVTHLFMHGSWGHVISNMFTLWIFGSMLENYVGAKRFITFYMICGLGAAFCHMGVSSYENYQLTQQANAFMDAPTFENLLELRRNFSLEATSGYSIDGLVEALHRDPNNPQIISVAKIFISNFVNAYRNVPLVGASGAVYGILFGAAYLFPNVLIYIYFLIPIRQKYVAAFMIITEIFVAVENNPNDNVAHFAHLGGVLISYFLIKNWKRRGLL
jgi:membrane associated rhomboid family serine protease